MTSSQVFVILITMIAFLAIIGTVLYKGVIQPSLSSKPSVVTSTTIAFGFFMIVSFYYCFYINLLFLILTHFLQFSTDCQEQHITPPSPDMKSGHEPIDKGEIVVRDFVVLWKSPVLWLAGDSVMSQVKHPAWFDWGALFQIE